MAKVYCMYYCFLIMVLLISPSVTSAVRKAGTARCQMVLRRSGCNLSACRMECLQEKNGNGVCIANSLGTDYLCICTYNC